MNNNKEKKYVLEYELPPESWVDQQTVSELESQPGETLEVYKGRGSNISPRIYELQEEKKEESKGNDGKEEKTTKIKISQDALSKIAQSPGLDQAIQKTIAHAEKHGAFHTYHPLHSIKGVYGAMVVEAIEAYLLTMSGYSTTLRLYFQEESVEFPMSLQYAATLISVLYSIFKLPQIAINLGVKLPILASLDFNKLFRHKTILNIAGTVLSAKEFVGDFSAIASGGLLYLSVFTALGLGMPGTWSVVSSFGFLVAATRYIKISLAEAGRMRELAGVPYTPFEGNNWLIKLSKSYSNLSRRLAPLIMLAAYAITILKWTNIFILYDAKSIKKLFDLFTPLIMLLFINGEYYNLRVQDWWMIASFNRLFSGQEQTPMPQERRLGLPGGLMNMLTSAERMLVSAFARCFGREQDPISTEKAILEKNKELIRAIMMFSVCSELVCLFTFQTIEPKALQTINSKIVTTVLAAFLPGFGYVNAAKEVQQVTWPMILDLCAKHPNYIGAFFMTQSGQHALREYLDQYFSRDKVALKEGYFSKENRDKHKEVSVLLNRCNNLLLAIGKQLDQLTVEKKQLSCSGKSKLKVNARNLTTFVIKGLMGKVAMEEKGVGAKNNQSVDLQAPLLKDDSEEAIGSLITDFLEQNHILEDDNADLQPLVQTYIKATIKFVEKVTSFVNHLIGNPTYQQRKGCSRLVGLFACYNPDHRPVDENKKQVSSSGVVKVPVNEEKLLADSNINRLWQITKQYPGLVASDVELVPTSFSMRQDV